MNRPELAADGSWYEPCDRPDCGPHQYEGRLRQCTGLGCSMRTAAYHGLCQVCETRRSERAAVGVQWHENVRVLAEEAADYDWTRPEPPPVVLPAEQWHANDLWWLVLAARCVAFLTVGWLSGIGLYFLASGQVF